MAIKFDIPQHNSQQPDFTSNANVDLPPQLLRDMQQQATQATQQQAIVADAQADATEIAAQSAQQSGSAIGAQDGATATGQGDAQADTQQQAISAPPVDAWNYFVLGWFDYHIANYKQYANRKTGFPNLDAKLLFLPGLYTIGAVSSLGKTTFIHQMADQMAANGEYILFFSLEQTQLEMFSKSISREMYSKSQLAGSFPTYTSAEIRIGDATANHPAELSICINDYIQKVGDRVRIIAPTSPPTVEGIQCEVENFINLTGQRPVVIVDYLQIIKPSMVNNRPMDPRTSIDHIVTSLKSMQKRYDLTVIAISSLNRQNYSVPLDYESFKESGGIEYTSDGIWGLQLSVIAQDDLFNKEGRIKEKREALKKAKREIPRRIQFVCLKNRGGRPNFVANFLYRADYDTFEPIFVNAKSHDWEDDDDE